MTIIIESYWPLTYYCDNGVDSNECSLWMLTELFIDPMKYQYYYWSGIDYSVKAVYSVCVVLWLNIQYWLFSDHYSVAEMTDEKAIIQNSFCWRIIQWHLTIDYYYKYIRLLSHWPNPWPREALISRLFVTGKCSAVIIQYWYY